MGKDCNECDDNRHDEYGDPCRVCRSAQEIHQALKLQELVKAQIEYESELNEGFNDYEKTALYLLETLVEESEK